MYFKPLKSMSIIIEFHEYVMNVLQMYFKIKEVHINP